MLLQMALFHSFSWPSNIPSHIVRSWCFFMSMTTKRLPSKNWTFTHWIEKFQTILQSLYQLIAPHGVCKSLFRTHLQQHGVFLKVWIDTNLIGENWHLVFFMYTSLIPSQAEHFSLRLLAMLISHLANILFIFFAYFPSSCFSLFHFWFYSTSVMWAANIFNFLFLCLSLHQSPVVTETWDHGALIFILLLSCFPSATWAGGRFAEKMQRRFVGLKPLLQVCGAGLHLHLSQWHKTISYTSPPNSSLQGMWIKHLLSPFPHNLVPLWLGTTRLPWTGAPSS